MSGGSKQTTATQATSAPWGPTQSKLINNLNNIESFYQSPAANQTYGGTTVIPFAPQTVQGMNRMEGIANQAMPAMQNPLNAFGAMVNYSAPRAQGDFSNDPTFAPLSALRDMPMNRARSDFRNDPIYGYLGALRNKSLPVAEGVFGNDAVFGSTQRLRDSLMPIAQGDFENDPAFTQTLGRAQNDAAKQVNFSMSGAGRYGSGQHTGRMVDAIGDLTARATLDRQNMALNQVNAMNDRLQGGRQDALNNYRGITGEMVQGQQSGMNQVLGLTNMLDGARQTATNNLLAFGNAMPAAYAAALAPGQTLASIGGQYENLAANYAQEQMERFYAPIELARRNLAEQNALYSGVGQLGGQQSGSSTVRTPGMSGTQMAGLGLSTAGRLAGGK